MRRIIPSIAILFVLVTSRVTIAAPTSGAAAAVELQLLSTAHAETNELPLTPEEWGYLRRKGKLLIGVTQSALPPLDIPAPTDFKGITADVVALLSEQLHVKVGVFLYPTRARALEALRGGTLICFPMPLPLATEAKTSY